MNQYKLTINNQTFEVTIGAIAGDMANVIVNHIPYHVNIDTAAVKATSTIFVPAPVSVSDAPLPASTVPRNAGAGNGALMAPIPGKIMQVKVRIGERVKSGQVVAIMEAMKMENDIISHVEGAVQEICKAAGSDVATGDVIMVIG